MQYVIANKLPYRGKLYYKGGTHKENGIIHANVCGSNDMPRVYQSFARAMRAAKGLNRKCNVETVFYPEEYFKYLKSMGL